MATFITDAEADGVSLEVELIVSKQIVAKAAIAARIGVPVDEVLHETTRRFLNKGHAIFLETEYVAASQWLDLLGEEKAQSPDTLDQRISPLGHSADIVVRMCAVQADEAGLLGLAPHQAGIEQEQLVRDKNGNTFCYSRQIWRGELAQFSAQAIITRS